MTSINGVPSKQGKQDISFIARKGAGLLNNGGISRNVVHTDTYMAGGYSVKHLYSENSCGLPNKESTELMNL